MVEQKLQPFCSNLNINMISRYLGMAQFMSLCGALSLDNNNFNLMKTNFDINIPSIPSKIIKFKIQDIKSTAFGSQRGRFNENKGFLTKKFIQSFNNFKEKEYKPITETQTEAQSQLSLSKHEHSEPQYRFLIPEQKKYMLHHYEKYRQYEAPILKATKYDRGYSFYKTDTITRNTNPRQSSHSIDERALTDNLYFPSQKEKIQPQPNPKNHSQPSCIFKNQTRKRVYSKMEKAVNAIPGPGAYFFPPAVKQPKPKPKQQEAQSQFDYKNLKQIITKIVVDEPQAIPKAEQRLKEEKKMNYMFIGDDRDRFGNQKYPIAQRANVPGPGSYEIKNSLEDHAKKIILVEQQRKLLKEWFNN